MKYNNPNIAVFESIPLSAKNKRTLAKLKRFDKSPLGKTFNLEKWKKIEKYCSTQIPLPNGDYAPLLDWMKMPLSLVFCYDFPIREIFTGVGRSNYKSGFGTMVAELTLLLGGRPNQAMKFMAVSKAVAESEMFTHLQLSLTSGVAAKQAIQINKDNVAIPMKSKLPTRGSSVVIRGADEKKLDGGREQLVVVDELGAMAKSPLGTLRQGLAKNEGLLLVTTTNNLIRGGAYDNEMKIFETYLDNDDFSRWSFIYELDDVEEVHQPDKWIKANPAIGIAVKQQDIQKDLDDAKADPSKMAVALTKRFNLNANGVNKYFSPQEVDAAQLMNFDFKGLYGVLGSDFSITGDTWGSVFLTMVGRTFYALPIAIRPQEKEDAYRHLGETHYHEGGRNDSIEGVKTLVNLLEENDLHTIKLAIDPAYSSRFLEKFEELGLYADVEKVKQNAFTMSSAIQSTKRSLQSGEMFYVGNLMKVHLLNAKVANQKDTAAIRLVKDTKEGKIDLTDALTNAVYVYESNLADFALYGEENLNTMREKGIAISEEGKLL